jgi:hypothetical protein
MNQSHTSWTSCCLVGNTESDVFICSYQTPLEHHYSLSNTRSLLFQFVCGLPCKLCISFSSLLVGAKACVIHNANATTLSSKCEYRCAESDVVMW